MQPKHAAWHDHLRESFLNAKRHGQEEEKAGPARNCAETVSN
jgi:hypothetical protein